VQVKELPETPVSQMSVLLLQYVKNKLDKPLFLKSVTELVRMHSGIAFIKWCPIGPKKVF